MLKLVEEKNNIQYVDECSQMEFVKAKERREARIRCLELEIEQEREYIFSLEKQLQKGKEDIFVALILASISIVILIAIGMNAMPIIVTMFQQPLIAVLIIGFLVKVVAYTIKHISKKVPMYIWCEMERKGMNVKHDNLFRQYKKHNSICRDMEEELRMLIMDSNE
ncbi:MAG: hypothetical protein E7264_03040 [Lachnospiraceae bacterium]|nr:hypothetical protein [Lachnospiraceae bacterium]